MTTPTRKSPAQDVINWLREETAAKNVNLPPNSKAYVVGLWVWIETNNQKPDEDTRAALKQAGFFWNRKRIAWQHPGGKPSVHSPKDPRAKYGRERIRLGEDD